MAEWNPFSHVCVDNPFPIYRELRDEQPVYHNEKMGFYALSRFDDVLYGLLHPALFKSSHGITLEHLDSPDQLLNKDDPEHLEHRKIVARRSPYRPSASSSRRSERSPPASSTRRATAMSWTC